MATIIGTAGPDTLRGTAAADTLQGLEGNDNLDGLGDADEMNGGLGDDLFWVDDPADRVVEAVGEGSDRVFARVSYVLTAGAEVERITTVDNSGTAAINLTGNEFANLIYGNAGNNILDGGAGMAPDQLVGLGGDDWYYVNHAGDTVTEASGGGNDRIFASVSYVLKAGAHVEMLTTSFNPGTDSINLTGNELSNVIYGNAGANILNGGGGTASDVLVGLEGDDTYYVNHAGDSVVESTGGGSDRILAAVSHTLAAGSEVEELRTQNDAGTAAINLTGNEFSNAIFGNAGNNSLNGGGGTAADTMTGLGGNDWYFVNRAGDVVIEGMDGGSDRIFASVSYVLTAGSEVEMLTTSFNPGTEAINLTGNELYNVLYGNAGNNTLDGGGGTANDVMVGLGGDDMYFVNHSGDRVVESVGGGSDRVLARVSFALEAGSEVERLTTAENFGTAAINLTGNEFANVIFGNAGANILDGGGGTAVDSLNGLAGDDLYFVHRAGDVVNEAIGGGSDRVFADVSYTLKAGSEVELLSTSFNAGTGAINLTGNEFDNMIYGNAGANNLNGGGGADVLIGLAGVDTLTGGLGADRFVYLQGGDAGDIITDFTKDQSDVLDLEAVLATAAGYDGTNAFSGGYLAFTASGADTLVQFDSTGGADSFVTLATMMNVLLQQSDTSNYIV